MGKLILFVLLLVFLAYYIVIFICTCFPNRIKFTNRAVTPWRLCIPFYFFFAPMNEKEKKNKKEKKN